MDTTSSRQPLFVAVACIALGGAWSTGAYEAQTGTSVAMLTQDPLASPSLSLDCPDPRGATRTLCLFEASRPASLPPRQAQTARHAGFTSTTTATTEGAAQ